MKRAVRIAAFVLAIAFLGVTVFNASWRADPPRGSPTLIAYRGVAQIADPVRAGEDVCPSQRIEPPAHNYIENTTRSMRQAYRLGARMVEIDVQRAGDGTFVLFHDDTLDCNTDGTGPVSGKTLAELKTLDAGYGYTADGKTYPLRGAVGQIPSLAEALGAAQGFALWFDLKRIDPADAPALIDTIVAAGRDPVARGDAFVGSDETLAAIRERFADAWILDAAGITGCTAEYRQIGWTGQVPASCEGGTMAIGVDDQWFLWGWPNLLIERMAGTNARILVGGAGTSPGLLLPEQFGEVPGTFNGHIMVGDIWNLGPALYPRSDPRGIEQQNASIAALARRRAALED